MIDDVGLLKLSLLSSLFVLSGKSISFANMVALPCGCCWKFSWFTLYVDVLQILRNNCLGKIADLMLKIMGFSN